MHWTLGILRDLQAFFWLRVFPAPKQNPRPPKASQRKPLKLSNKWKKASKARLRTILIYEETRTIENLQFGFFDSLVRRLPANSIRSDHK